MPDVKNPNGTPLYFYTDRAKRESQITALKTTDKKLNRKQRRMLERKLAKYASKISK